MVYGIFSGEYSFWNCEGYFDTQDEAKAYCDKLNAKHEYENFYIKVLYNLADGEDRECKKAYGYYNRTGEWEREKYRDDDILTGSEPSVYARKKGEECVIVFATDEDAHKVPKIAQDAIAKYWAEREGL